MVFMDVAGIEAGRDFRKAIEKSIAQTLFCVAGFCSSKAFRSVEV
jgi:hypothetical protein